MVSHVGSTCADGEYDPVSLAKSLPNYNLSTHDTPPKENMRPSTTLASKKNRLPTPIC